MNLNLNYYFTNYDTNEIFNELFKSTKDIWNLNKSAKEYLKNNITDKDIKENKAELLGNVTFIGNYFVDEGTKIYPGVVIEGPVYIGKNCSIMPGAYVRPGTIVGDGCVIGFNSEVKNSIIQNGAKIASLAFVGDSVLGKSARIGSGVITANRRFDQDTIKIKNENLEKIDTENSFFGCFLGDYSRIGANSVTSPGTFIGQYTWIFPGTSIHGFIPSEKRVYQKKEIIFDDNQKIELK